MRGWVMAAAMAAGLTGCVAATAAADTGLHAISYETGPCFGACPVYRVTVDRDGNGLFEGRRFTAVEGERTFQVTPDQFRAFARHLEPLRPASGDRLYSGEACDTMATDLPSAEVAWMFADEAEQRLYFYFGCDMDRNRAIAERLEGAPDLLPIGDLIGSPR